MRIAVALRAMAGAENCDGEPYDLMQLASEHIDKLEAEKKTLREALEALSSKALEFDGDIYYSNEAQADFIRAVRKMESEEQS
jgi:hypothetical protein